MKFDQIPARYSKILLKLSQDFPTIAPIIAEEVQDSDTIEYALIEITTFIQRTAFGLLDTIAELENDKNYTTKEMINHLMFDDSYFVTKVECIENEEERYYIIERQDGSTYKLSEKLIKRG